MLIRIDLLMEPFSPPASLWRRWFKNACARADVSADRGDLFDVDQYHIAEHLPILQAISYAKI